MSLVINGGAGFDRAGCSHSAPPKAGLQVNARLYEVWAGVRGVVLAGGIFGGVFYFRDVVPKSGVRVRIGLASPYGEADTTPSGVVSVFSG